MHKLYLKIWLVSASVTVLMAGVFSFLVDPYGLFRSVVVNGVNQNKEGVRNKVRFVKALELPIRKPKTLLMGSSRVWNGVNPDHSLLQEYSPVYNIGVDLSRIHEIRLLLQHAIVNADVKRVILGLDFFMFNALQRTNTGFDVTLVGRAVKIEDYLFPAILSRDSVIDSLRVMRFSKLEPELQAFLPNGFRPQGSYAITSYENFHYYTNWIFLTPQPQNTFYYGKMALDEEVFNEFEAVLALCELNHIDLHLYISPAHATLEGEGLRALGKWDDFENWKVRVTKISDQYKVPLWDFSGYNSITTEPVRTPMKYYADSSHFTEVVSDLIMKRLFGKGESVPSDFGVRLSPQNVDKHLDEINANREQYVLNNRSEIASLLADYRAIIGGAKLDLNRTKF
jgi:hypothetical protein